MVRCALFIAVLATSISDHALARRIRGPVPTVAHVKAPAEKVAAPAVKKVAVIKGNTGANETGIPVLVVEEVEEVVPVMQVVEVEDSDSAVEQEHQHEQAADGVGPACKSEMVKLMSDQTRLLKSMECEKKTKHAEIAVKALQQADATGAKEAVVKTFHECGNVSVSCAGELAPDLVLKMRLTGVAVTKACADVAHSMEAKGPPNSTVAACQTKVMDAMGQKLMTEDFEGAIDMAEGGMSDCSGIHHPCDFQLAPVLLVSLMQAGMQQEEEQIMPVLLHSLQAMEQMSMKLAAHENATKQEKSQPSAKTHESRSRRPQPSVKKAVSLLSVAKHVRIMRTYKQ